MRRMLVTGFVVAVLMTAAWPLQAEGANVLAPLTLASSVSAHAASGAAPFDPLRFLDEAGVAGAARDRAAHAFDLRDRLLDAPAQEDPVAAAWSAWRDDLPGTLHDAADASAAVALAHLRDPDSVTTLRGALAASRTFTGAPVPAELERLMLGADALSRRFTHGQGARDVASVLDAALALQGGAARSAIHVPHFQDVSDAVRALYGFYGAAPPARAAHLADLPPDAQHAVAAIVTAHLVQGSAARVAFASDDVDIDLLKAARRVAATQVAKAVPALACRPGLTEKSSAVFNYDFSCQDTTWGSSAHAPLIIEAGGNDLYYLKAGAASGRGGAAMLVDVSGHDRYKGFGNANAGAARDGSGFLFDAAGDDEYATTGLTANGAALGGVGFLFDGGGDDAYTTQSSGGLHINGAGGLKGAGFLFDWGGNDVYEVAAGDYRCMNGCGMGRGEGLLVDGGGNDRYGSAGTRGAMNGAATVGTGALLDFGGDDVYWTGTGSTFDAANGAATEGTGLLFDAKGDDVYEAGARAAHGGALRGPEFLDRRGHNASAALVDLDGVDAYTAVSPADGALNGGAVAVNAHLTYRLQRGESETTPPPVWAMLLDGGFGADSFHAHARGLAGLNGGALATVLSDGAAQANAHLIDATGDSEYVGRVESPPGASARAAVNGAAWGYGTGQGVVRHLQVTGLLLDGSGRDLYDATVVGGQLLANGAAANHVNAPAASAALLVDARIADDVMTASGGSSVAANAYGSGRGIGVVVDAGGNDERSVTSTGDAAGHAAGSSSLLIDALGGNDRYSGAGAGFNVRVNAAGLNVLLADLGGDDQYVASSTGTLHANGAFVGGTGVSVPLVSGLPWLPRPPVQAPATLFDAAGNDHYEATASRTAFANGASDRGTALLVDGGGSDRYELSSVSTAYGNGAGTGGVSLLVDTGGDNAFVAAARDGATLGAATSGRDIVSLCGVGNCLRVHSPSIGILLAGPGNDSFTGHGVTQGAGDRYGVGVLVDSGGRNTYVTMHDDRARQPSIGQGAGRDGGLGVLVDHGDVTTFTLEADTIGQGSGLAGVGVLARTQPLGRTDYIVHPSARAGVTQGGGVGVRVDAGTTDVLDDVGDLSCGDATPIATVGDPTVLALQLCGHSEASKRRIVNPVTDEDMDDVPKPSVPCSMVGPGVCGAVAALLGPDAPDWLARGHVTTTTAGGFLFVHFADVDGSPFRFGRLTRGGVDETCDMSCAFETRLAAE